MTQDKSQGLSKGQTITSLMISVAITFASVTWVWNSGLSVAIFNNHADVASVGTSVKDIQDTLNRADLPSMKAELDFLATQRGYKPTILSSATSTNNSQSDVQTTQ